MFQEGPEARECRERTEQTGLVKSPQLITDRSHFILNHSLQAVHSLGLESARVTVSAAAFPLTDATKTLGVPS